MNHPANAYPNHPLPDVQALTAQEIAVLRTLLYFDVFQYPLTLEEIHTYHSTKMVEAEALLPILEQLVQTGFIHRFHSFYTVHNNAALIRKRLDRNNLAAVYLKKAVRMTARISRFPFVQMVALSGSLSKNAADPESDIDYFIITRPGRVWVTRFLLTLYKKTVLLNSSKYFCTNLIMANNHLVFDDRSHYIATEITSLLPLYGEREYNRFMEANDWTEGFFPNAKRRADEIAVFAQTKHPATQMLEWLLSGKIGDCIDVAWRKIIRKKWTHDHSNRQYVMQNPKDYIDIQPHIMKGHGGDQYPRIREAYRAKLVEFEGKHGIEL